MMVGMREAGLQRVVAVDWSGRVDVAGQRRHIWAGVWTASSGAGGGFSLESGRTREELIEWLVEMAGETPRMVVGFDFSFSYPAWFLEELGIASAPEFWRSVADGQGERWLHRECEDGRFWGKPKKKPAEFCGEHAHRMLRRVETSLKVRALIADSRESFSSRMDSMSPVVSLAWALASPESTLRAAISASMASSLPRRARVARCVVLTSKTSTWRSRKNLVRPAA